MKLKVLLPVERLGQLIIQGDPSQSFYQVIRPWLEEYKLDVQKYYLRNLYGKVLNMALPMEKAGFYPGISVELLPNEEIATPMDVLKNPLANDRISVKLLLLYNNQGLVALEVNRHTSVKAALSTIRIELPRDVVVWYREKQYTQGSSFAQIGVIESGETLELVAAQIADEEGGKPIQQLQENEELSKEEYEQMLREQQAWKQEMGYGQFLTKSEQDQLLQTRVARKAALHFKVISSQLRLNLNLIFSIPSNATLADIYHAFNQLLIKKFKDTLSEEQIALLILNGYTLHNGRGGETIFASDFKAYDFFAGGDATLDLQLDEQWTQLQWQ